MNIKSTPTNLFYFNSTKKNFFPPVIESENQILEANNFSLLAAYTVIHPNCEKACAENFEDLEEKNLYLENSRVNHKNLRQINNQYTKGIESCIRKCFVERLTAHFGSDIQDYIYNTAFEYKQEDMFALRLNKVIDSCSVTKEIALDDIKNKIRSFI